MFGRTRTIIRCKARNEEAGMAHCVRSKSAPLKNQMPRVRHPPGTHSAFFWSEPRMNEDFLGAARQTVKMLLECCICLSTYKVKLGSKGLSVGQGGSGAFFLL
jgi:hypothetical protein